MKRFFYLLVPIVTLIFCMGGCFTEDKSKRTSPPAVASETTIGGHAISINYSRPSLKGRMIGKGVAPYGKVWETGANEATTFEISKDAKVQGKALKAGKYSLYTIPGPKAWTIIFNKTWEQWGVEYKEEDDVLRVQALPEKAPEYVEIMKFIIEPDGKVLLFWGDIVVGFNVE